VDIAPSVTGCHFNQESRVRRAWQMLLATSEGATEPIRRGYKVHWISQRAISARPYHSIAVTCILGHLMHLSFLSAAMSYRCIFSSFVATASRLSSFGCQAYAVMVLDWHAAICCELRGGARGERVQGGRGFERRVWARVRMSGERGSVCVRGEIGGAWA